MSPEIGVRFGRVPAHIGANWRVEVHARSAASVPDAQGAQTQVSEYDSAYTVEVLAVDGPAPSRVKLTFERNAHRYQLATKPTSIEGKTYVVDAAAPFVRDASGSAMAAASEEETQRVLDVFPELGTRAQIDQVLPDRAMSISEERHDLAAAILKVIHPRAWRLDQGQAVLARVDGEDAVFDVTLAATSQTTKMTVRGEARIRRKDARLTSLSLEGSYITIAEREAEPGTITITRTVRD